mgnify:CR=1 FL=1
MIKAYLTKLAHDLHTTTELLGWVLIAKQTPCKPKHHSQATGQNQPSKQ